MPDTGWVLTGLGTNVATGTKAWTTPNNISTAGDGAYAQAASMKSGGTSQILVASTFDFSSIPVGASITGIEARVRKRSNFATACIDHTIQIMVGSTAVGSNLADSVTEWGTGFADANYGGSSNLWGATPSRSDVVSSTFGLHTRAAVTGSSMTRYAEVATVEMKITYSLGGNPGAFFALFSVKDRIREILKPKRRFWLPEPALA